MQDGTQAGRNQCHYNFPFERRRESLAKKLSQRNQDGKGYPKRAAIENDIKDLAGARIALYFPDDMQRVETLIRNTFHVVEKVSHPRTEEQNSRQMRPHFDGYCADHYRVTLGD
jgi:ppGpp synthetase/RelA/SpoT-type nucleotidyltranferase